MAHDHHNRVALFEVFLAVAAVVNNFIFNGDNNFFFNTDAEFMRDNFSRIKINGFIDGCHDAEGEQFFNNFRTGHLHHSRKVRHRDFLRHGDDHLRFFGAFRRNPVEALCFRLPA